MNYFLNRGLSSVLCRAAFCKKFSTEFSPRQSTVELEDGVRILATPAKSHSLLWYENQMIKLGDGRNVSF